MMVDFRITFNISITSSPVVGPILNPPIIIVKLSLPANCKDYIDPACRFI